MNLNPIQRERRWTPQALPNPLSHAAIRADLKSYQDGELFGWRQWRLERHLSRCMECEKEITRLKRISAEMHSLPQPLPRPELRARILASLPETPPQTARTRPASPPRNVPGRLALAGATCGLLLISLFASGLYRGASGTPSTSHLPPILPDRTPVVVASPPRHDSEPAQADETTATAAKRSGIDLGNPSSSGTDISSAQPDPAAQTVSAPYTDPTSIAANRLLAQQSEELDRAVKRARREQERMQQLALRHATEMQFAQRQQAGSPALQLAVSDVSAAAQRVRDAVQTLGGSVDGVTGSTIVAPSTGKMNAIPREPNDPAIAGASSNTVISIRVPTAQAAALRSTLGKLGVLTQVKNGDTTAQRGAMRYAIKPSIQVDSDRMPDTYDAGDGPRRIPHAVPFTLQPAAPSELRGSNYVAYTIRLQPDRQK